MNKEKILNMFDDLMDKIVPVGAVIIILIGLFLEALIVFPLTLISSLFKNKK